MAQYQALYRAWRPDRFEDICGQEAITKTLRRQIMSGHIAHAYLFCGSRGTGKTTAAKVLARAVNCLRPVDGEPCGECDVCRELKDERTMDVLEIDAASNNGVDEVRLLRDRIVYPPTVGKYKVYIIDEVHMLSTSAFNALLKTLEEPPAHAVFILATTEPQKLPATVLSRCQRYDFKRIPASLIVSRMKVILNGIGREADDDALQEIAAAAEGGMRDALSLLDMCLSYAQATVSASLVREVLGTTGREFMFAFVGALEKSDAGEALRLIDRAMRDGRDAQVFARETAAHMRLLMMARLVGNDLSALAEITPEDAARFVEQSQLFERERLTRAMELFIRAESDMKWVSNPRSILELCTVRAARISEEKSVAGLTERIEALEKALAAGTALPASAAPAAKPAAAPAKADKPAERPAAPEAKAPASEEEKVFTGVIEKICAETPSIRGYLRDLKFVGIDGDVINTRLDGKANFQKQFLERRADPIGKALSDAFGRPLKLNITTADAARPAGKGVSGRDLSTSYDIFGRDKVELVD